MRLLLTTLALAGCAPTLAGRLTTAEGEPVAAADARVNVSSLDSDATFVLPVDSSGKFAASDALPDGDYLVEALVPGYKIESQRITLGRGDTPTVELNLSPLEKTRAHATSANLEAPEGRGAGGASLTPPTF
jgi:hypothetical protein